MINIKQINNTVHCIYIKAKFFFKKKKPYQNEKGEKYQNGKNFKKNPDKFSTRFLEFSEFSIPPTTVLVLNTKVFIVRKLKKKQMKYNNEKPY